MSGSEVERLRKRIRLEYEAAQRGLSGTAQGTAQHAFITQRLENMAAHHQALKQLVGEQGAIEILVEVLEPPGENEAAEKSSLPTET